MNKHYRELVSAVCSCALAFGAFATDWYVDQTNGDNEKDGQSPATAKKALSTVWQTLAKPGDTVWIMGEMKISSTIDINQNPGIVIAGYGEDVTIGLKDGYSVPLLKISVDSVVSNLTFKGGVGPTANAGLNSYNYPAAGVEVLNGKLTHCKVTGCRPYDADYHCSAVRITGTGIVEDCDIFENSAGKLNDAYAAGVDVKSENAKLLNSRIYNCRGRAAAVFVEKGLVEGCDIYCNTNYPASELSGGVAGSSAGLRVDGSSSKVASCRIYGNYGYSNGGGLWLRDGAIVENCLIYNNHAESNGGAIYSNSGNSIVRFCNIGGNDAGGSDGAAIYVKGGNPVFKNNIIYGNGTEPAKEIKLESTSAPFTYNLLSAAKTGEGNIVATKSPYVDAAQGDYLTADDSEGIDKGTNLSDVGKDILGNARPLDGGTGIGAVSDIGCVEYVNPEIPTSPVVYMNPNGSDEPPYDTVEKGAHDLASALAAVDPSVLGHGEVRVCVGDYAVANVGATVAQPILIYGWDPEKDAASEVKVTLFGTSLLLNNANASVAGIDFSGCCADKEYCVKVTQGMVTNCVIRGFRYEIAKSSVTADGRPDFNGGALVLSGSDVAPKVCRTVDTVVSNCVVTLASDFQLKSYMFGLIGGGVAFRSATEATLERCLVCDCSAAGNGGGIAVESNSARILDCEVAHCRASIKDNSDTDLYVVYGGGIFIKGTSGNMTCVSGCTIHDNFSNGSGGGVYVGNYGGPVRIWNCRIEDNKVYAFSGTGLRVEREASDVAVVNCLITGNDKGKQTGAASGVYLKGGRMVNCTISGNKGGESAAGVTVYARTTSDVDERGKNIYVSYVRNSIVWGNEPTDWDGTSAKNLSFGGEGNDCSNVVVPEADKITGTAIITADPKLTKTYELRGSSSAINAGDNSFYNVDNFGYKDLAGNDRFYKDSTIDCGCFERGSVPGLVLLFR